MKKLLENTRRPDITFNSNGRILITSRLVRMLSITPGDGINIILHNDEFLLYVVRHGVGRHEAQCYPTKKGSRNFCANSVRLARTMMKLCHTVGSRVAFMAGEEIIYNGTVYCPIITHLPL